jgi:transposase-like protein
MFCPMCRSEHHNLVNEDTINTTLFECKNCGYSRVHRKDKTFLELYLDFCEFQCLNVLPGSPSNREALRVLQDQTLEQTNGQT